MKARLATVSPVAVVLLALLTIFASGDYSAHAHPTVHPQKKLFSGRWYKPSADLTTSPPWFGVTFPDASPPEFHPCDGGYDTASCVSKWQGPATAAYADWNSQPSTARFNFQGFRHHNWDNNLYIIDNFSGAPPGLLGFATYHDSGGNSCLPDFYPGSIYCSVYRYSDAVILDDNHTGVFSTAQRRQATIAHELGHVLSLRHESVNADESVLYECGQDDTGPKPPSVMSYDCVYPPGYPYYGSGIYTVQDWDTCGVNHAYPDPIYDWEECVCYPPPAGGPAPAGTPAFFHPVTPARILDTRSGPGPTGKVGENCVISVQVAGVGGLPASGVSAVVLNATVTAPSAGSYLTLYPSGSSLPLASNLNFSGGQTVPNLVTVKVGSDGKINVYNNKGTTHVVLDVAGWYDSTPDVGPDVIGIDVGTSGNTATSVGTIEHCAQTSPGSTVTVDLFVTNIQPYYDNGTLASPGDDTGGIIAWNVGLQYNETLLTVTTENQNFLVRSNAGSSLFSTSDPLPDSDGNGTWLSSSLDTSGGVPEGGTGVLSRINITVDAGTPAGQYAVTLDLASTVIVDVANNSLRPDLVGHAAIAVGQPCGVVLAGSGAGPGPTQPAYGYYHPVSPARVLDTRTGPGSVGKVGPGGTITVDVTGTGGVPATGVTAVVLNATVTEPSANSYLTVFPSGVSMPLASNLNFPTGETIPNLVIVKVGGDGNVKAFNAQGSTHVIFDVAGWFGGFGSDGTLFRSLTPGRILDTRSGPQGNPAGPVDQGETITVDVTGPGGVPVSGVSAVVLNVTVTGPTSASFLTVFPSGAALPLASNLNFAASVTAPNLVVVKVGTDGYVKVYNQIGSVHVVIDVAGWYSGP